MKLMYFQENSFDLLGAFLTRRIIYKVIFFLFSVSLIDCWLTCNKIGAVFYINGRKGIKNNI